jgi:hypothetical protein
MPSELAFIDPQRFVAVRSDTNEVAECEFASFTEDLEALAEWLTQSGVDVLDGIDRRVLHPAV